MPTELTTQRMVKSPRASARSRRSEVETDKSAGRRHARNPGGFGNPRYGRLGSLRYAVHTHGNRATELAMMEIFRANGFAGWRRHPKIFGKPDFIFPKFKIAVFVDGCFWHGCPRCYNEPKSNRAFWRQKIATNRKRDSAVNSALRKSGWQVLRVWQHELKRKNESRLLCRLAISRQFSRP